MIFTYSLIRIVSSTELKADASNDVSVTYRTPAIEVIVGGVNFDEAKAKLDDRSNEIAYFNALQERRMQIWKRPNKRSRQQNEDLETELEEEIANSKHPYHKGLYFTNSYNVWGIIESRLEKIAGEYLIVPSVYAKLTA